MTSEWHDPGRMVGCEEARDLLAGYSLDALEQDERDVIDDHLARCPDCRAELRDLQEAAGRLALAVLQLDLPAGAKQRFVTAVTDQSRRRLAPDARRWRLLGFPRLAPSTLAACAALVVALTASLWAAGLKIQLDEQRALVATLRERANRYDRVVAVLQSPDMQLRSMQGTQLAPSAIGRIYVDPDSGQGMMMVRSLPPLLEGRAYQLWWVRADGKRESGGLLRITDAQGNGYALIQCPGSLSTWQSVGITEEPSTGSPAPTGQRLLGGPI